MPNEEVVERIAINIHKINEIEYEIAGSIDVQTVLDNTSQFDNGARAKAFAAIETSQQKQICETCAKDELKILCDALISDMRCIDSDTTRIGDDYSVPDMTWLKQVVSKFLDDTKTKVLAGGREETIVRTDFSGEKIKEKKFVKHQYELFAKCSSILSNIEVGLRDSESGFVEDSLCVRCVECVLGKNAKGYLLRQYDPDESIFPEYRTNLTYMVTGSGDVVVERPVRIASRFIIIPEDKFGHVIEYDCKDLMDTIMSLASEVSTMKMLPSKLDGLQLKRLKDAKGVKYPVLVLGDVKAKLRNTTNALEVDLARYLFNEARYYYGDIIFFSEIFQSSDDSLEWSGLMKGEQEKYIRKLETAVRSLNDTLAKYFGLRDKLVISMDRENLGVRVNRQFFNKAYHKGISELL